MLRAFIAGLAIFPGLALAAITGPATDNDGSYTISWTATPSFFATAGYVTESKNGGAAVSVGNSTSGSYAASGKADGTYVYTQTELRTVVFPVFNVQTLTSTHTVVVSSGVSVPGPISGPTNDADGSFTLSWGGVSGASKYTLQRQINSGSWSTIQDTSATSKAQSALGNAVYRYRVRACNSAGTCSGWTATKTVQVAKAPGVPGAISAPSEAALSTNYTVSWGASSGSVSKYELQQRVNSAAWSTVQSSTATSKTFSQSGLGTYSYRVRACRTTGSYTNCSGYNAIKSTVISLVPTPVVPATSTGSYTVTWSTSNPTYRLQERFNGGSWVNVHIGVGTSKAFSGKASGTYEYRIHWYNVLPAPMNLTISQFSGIDSVVVTGPPPAPNLTAPTNDANGAYSVSWTAASGATRYELQRQTNGGSWSLIQNSSATSKSESGLSNATYGYRVRACNTAGCSTYSSVDTTQVAIAPGVPGAIQAPAEMAINTAYTVSWGASTGSVSKYELQQRVSNGAWITVQSSAATSKSFSQSTVGVYDYQVRACRTTGSYTNCSAYTAIKTTTIPLLATPVVPAANNTGSYTVTWAVSNPYYFLEERFNGGSWTVVHTGVGTSKALSGKASGTYEYRLRWFQQVVLTGFPTIPINHYSGIATIVVTGPPPIPDLTVPASDGDGNYSVSWNSTSGATSYELRRRVNGGAWTTFTDASPKNETGLGNGLYDYQVRACNNAGLCSEWSAIQSVPVAIKPGVPGAISTPAEMAINTEYMVTWGASTGSVSQYELQERVNGGAWNTLTSTVTNMSFTQSTIGNFEYQVRACRTTGSYTNCSGYSAIQTTVIPLLATPTAPATNNTGSYTVNWSVSSPYYFLEESFNGGAWTVVHSGIGTQEAFTNKALGTYQYRLHWLQQIPLNGFPAIPINHYSGIATVVVSGLPAPSLTVPTMDEDGNYEVSWNLVAGAASYELQRRVNAGAWSTLTGGVSPKYQIGLGDGVYDYQVRACNAAGCSDYSAIASVTVSLTNAGASVAYLYDDLGRLKRVTYASGVVIEYSYDPAGNRTTQVISGASN